MAQPKNKKRRSRKRTGPGGGPRPTPPKVPAGPSRPAGRSPAAGPPTLKAPRSEAPKPIWAPLPITELLILLGLVVAAVGLVRQSGPTAIAGLVILMVGSLELAAREHFAGYRSHSSLLAGIGALVSTVVVGLIVKAVGASLPVWPLLIVAAVIFAAGLTTLRRAFRRRSGGLSYRV